jgi:hypothetical protein
MPDLAWILIILAIVGGCLFAYGFWLKRRYDRDLLRFHQSKADAAHSMRDG